MTILLKYRLYGNPQKGNRKEKVKYKPARGSLQKRINWKFHKKIFKTILSVNWQEGDGITQN